MSLLHIISKRRVNLLGFIICASLIATALYLQEVGHEPCPLCILQRVAFIAMGILFLLAALHNPTGRIGGRIYGLLIATVGTLGGIIAGRHVWLQHLPPDQVPECGPGLEYMIEVFPLAEAMQKVFKGSGECAEVSWTFLTLSIPEWSLILFFILSVVGLLRNWAYRERSNPYSIL
ncbi:MAG: disulfide bond formation protein B [Candidatus Polarisedimenticolaceae bacterium]|nr:disulfide bond formation protein B [Candidatus Polarisedimenticolaceae bacterium]